MVEVGEQNGDFINHVTLIFREILTDGKNIPFELGAGNGIQLTVTG